MEGIFVKGKNIKGILEHNQLRKGKTREEVYGKEKAEEWRKNQRISALGEKAVWFNKNLSEEHKQKISNALKGKIPKNLSQINSNKNGEGNPMYGKFGELSPNWRGGIAFEPYSVEFNDKFKRAIRKRDNQICILCGIHREKLKIALAIHHINYDKLLSIPQNCVSLCNNCHSKTNNNRKYWTKFFQSLLSEKYDYQYTENGEIKLEIIPK